MSKKKVKEAAKELSCRQCGHRWRTRPGRLAKAKRLLPAVCPRCISSEWAKGAKKKVASKAKATSKRASAPRKKAVAPSAPVEDKAA